MNTVNASVPIEMLLFDPENPRLPPFIDGSDDCAVLEWMLEDAGLVELMGSIATKGYFGAEPLLVMEASGGGDYWVLEGNRRLAAVKLLLDPSTAPRRATAVAAMSNAVVDRAALKTLPVVIFAQRADVLDYLGYRHITGVKQWEPAAKARYLRKLYDAHIEVQGSDVYRYIARLIGTKQDYVKRLLAALTLHGEVEKTGVLPVATDVPFSLLTLALNYSEIVNYLGLKLLDQDSLQEVDSKRLGDLAKWLYVIDPESGRTALGESRNMRFLAAAVSTEAGVTALSRGETAEAAARSTLDPTKIFLRAVRDSRDRLLAAQNLVHRSQITEDTLDVVAEVAKIARQLQLIASQNLADDNGDVL